MGEQIQLGLKKEMFSSIELRLNSYMNGRIYPFEIATTLNFILYNEFNKYREDLEGNACFLKPVFVGEYIVDKNNPYQTRVFCHQGTEACSPIPIKRGVIGRAIRTGRDQYVPDVTKDLEHIGCDPNMEGSELVLNSWSDHYPSGPYRGLQLPLGVLDLDFNIKNALELKDIQKLRNIWNVWGKKIFPGYPTFLPLKEVYKDAFEISLLMSA